jgi:hypothetical protein
VTEALDRYLAKITPAAWDKTTVSQRRAKIETALQASSAGLHLLRESGSFSHGTSIAGHSDVDYLASLGCAKPSRPSTALGWVRDALNGSDWSIIDLKVSSPTVKIRYTSAPHFEVAPGFFYEEDHSFPVYHISGPYDEWIKSAPTAHNAYVTYVNKEKNGKVKPLARLVKAWKYSQGVPISSFYLEMRATEYADGEQTIIYDIDLRYLLQSVLDKDLRDMNDPLGIVGRIPACSSQAAESTTRRHLREAIKNLDEANAAQKARDKAAYWIAMSRVFNDFPYPLTLG